METVSFGSLGFTGVQNALDAGFESLLSIMPLLLGLILVVISFHLIGFLFFLLFDVDIHDKEKEVDVSDVDLYRDLSDEEYKDFLDKGMLVPSTSDFHGMTKAWGGGRKYLTRNKGRWSDFVSQNFNYGKPSHPVMIPKGSITKAYRDNADASNSVYVKSNIRFSRHNRYNAKRNRTFSTF